MRCASMASAPQKLYSLARQSRALAGTVSDRQRAEALRTLARLYERQAQELEIQEVAQPSFTKVEHWIDFSGTEMAWQILHGARRPADS